MFKNTISNLSRIRQVAEVLIRYGFEDVVTSTAPAAAGVEKPAALVAGGRAGRV